PPSVLQVIEPKVQLLPTEPHHDASSIVLRPSAGELNRAWCDVQLLSTVSFSSQSESVDINRDVLKMISGPESRLCCLETTESHLLNLEECSQVPDVEERLPDIQVVEPYLQLPFDTSHSEPSADVLSVDIRRYFLWMRRGLENRVCWFSTTETCYLNHLGFPYDIRVEDCFTGIQSVSGRVTEIISCDRVEASVIVALEDFVCQYIYLFISIQLAANLKKVTSTYLHVATDGQLDTCTWEEKYIESPHGEAQSEPDPEECEETPEEVEVPFISWHLAERGVSEIDVKLPALRQAFATLLASIHNQNFLFVVGKKIVMRLAAANKQEAVRVQLAYEDLIQFLRTPSNQESIAAELSGANLHHYNFVDVFYELLVFRVFISGSAPETFEGGFLERLMALISMWDVDVWEPAAGLYITELIKNSVHSLANWDLWRERLMNKNVEMFPNFADCVQEIGRDISSFINSHSAC
ncbi:hypothetical protein QTP86_020890, partial [Hemibagrus guttatus]